jgi:SAM-dependent methyltransferase
MTQSNQTESVREAVRSGYKKIAEQEAESCCGPKQSASCCGSRGADSASQLAQAVGYDLEDLDSLPEGANMGLSCGNPVALASLKAGEVFLDLGSGGGFDVFIGGRKVGPQGRAMGVDMTHEMLAKARRNAEGYRRQTGMDNVEFRLGEIEHLPVADNTVDVCISNCVINLSPEKPQVWREIARVLKPGGRAAISDLALLKPLPESVRSMTEALVACVAGAVPISETRRMAEEAGLANLELVERPYFTDASPVVQDPTYKRILELMPDGESPADYIVTLELRARKPA